MGYWIATYLFSIRKKINFKIMSSKLRDKTLTDFITNNTIKHYPVTELVGLATAYNGNAIGLADHGNHGSASPAIDGAISEHRVCAQQNQIDSAQDGADGGEEYVGAVDAHAREQLEQVPGFVGRPGVH